MTPAARSILAYAGLCVATVALAGLRILGLKSPPFQAASHLFVGGMFGAGLAARPRDAGVIALAALLSLVELACFLLGVGGHP